MTGAGAVGPAAPPAAAAAVRKGAVLVPVYRGGMPGAGGVRICDVAVASTTTLGGCARRCGASGCPRETGRDPPARHSRAADAGSPPGVDVPAHDDAVVLD